MANETKDFTIRIQCNEAFYRALVFMLRYAKNLGDVGSSRVVAIYCDGDGVDRIRELEVSEPIPERPELGMLTRERLQEIKPGWTVGDFLLDTDVVFHEVE